MKDNLYIVLIILSILVVLVVVLLIKTKKELEKKNEEVFDLQSLIKYREKYIEKLNFELRTDISNILGISKDLRRRSNLPNYLLNDVEDLVKSSDELTNLSESILDINKTGFLNKEVVEECYDPNTEFSNIITICTGKIDSKISIIKNFNLPDNLYGDRLHVKEIINIILNEVIDGSNFGKIYFNCKYENYLLNIEIISEEVSIDKFNNNFNIHSSKKITELLKGTYNISTKNNGTIFNIIIPQKIAEKGENVEKTEIKNDTEKHMLIVDDNELNIKIAKKSLETIYNLKIDTATSGKEAISLNQSNKYDIILMDIMMPDLSGEETLNSLKQISGFNTPIIAVTADSTQDKKVLKEKGFVSYITKPYRRSELIEKVEEILNR